MGNRLLCLQFASTEREEQPPEWHSLSEQPQCGGSQCTTEALDAGQAEAVQQGEATECGKCSYCQRQ